MSIVRFLTDFQSLEAFLEFDYHVNHIFGKKINFQILSHIYEFVIRYSIKVRYFEGFEIVIEYFSLKEAYD